MIVNRPFPHKPDPDWADPVDDEVRVIGGAEVLSQKRVRVPDGAEQIRVGDHLGTARDPDLVVPVVEVIEFNLWVCGYFAGLSVPPQVRDIDGEPFNLHR